MNNTHTPKRIFVGTLFCGENEFDQCVASVERQRSPQIEIEHLVIRDKRELDAHCELYEAWNSCKSGFDAFIKVDADMVIKDGVFMHALRCLGEFKDPNITMLEYRLQDFFTDRVIVGMNVFTPKVTFTPPDDTLFCDRAIDNVKIHVPTCDGTYYIAGKHAPDPSMRQAFHFGLHRGLKRRLGERVSVEDAWKRLGDKRRLMALYGFDASKRFNDNNHCYSDDAFSDAYAIACQNLARFHHS